jgi:hypothetical protein
MISSFPTKAIANMPGIQSFLFSPYQNIASIPPAPGKKIITPVVFKPGYGFLTGYSTPGLMNLVETGAQDANGPIYDWLITGFYPGDDDSIIDLFTNMEIDRYVVLTKDNSGILRLVGINAPLNFVSVYDSGKEPGTDAKGYTFTFSGQSALRAPRYVVTEFAPPP